LRCASALFVHREELDVARDILSRAPNLTSDPWILAPYVAICDLGDFKQYHHRTASRILEDAGLGLRDRAELAAALGTSELNAGGDRKGRQLLRRSAVDPTENSLAQVEWVSARTRSQLLEQAPPDVPHNFEALARRFQTDRKWQDAITSSASWLADQPFSSEAAAFGSFCSWVDEDWASTYNFAAAGFKANPADTMLKNNMALGRIETGEFADAISFLAKCRMMEAAPAERAVLCATEGLLFFRLGRTDEGRRRYERAISYFERHRVNSSAALAALMLAREEALTRSSAAPAALKVADSFIGEKPWPHLVTLRDRIGKLVSDPPHLLQAPHLRTDIARSLIELRGPSRLDAEEPVGDALAERATIS
jgi:tetratricopeptide (TPR) repeat protein